MGGFKLELKGVSALLKKIDPTQLQKNADAALDDFGLRVVNDAKGFAPVDEGHLRQSITYEKRKLEVSILVNADYAAYIEFGTRRYAAKYVSTLPADWQKFAAQFKGKTQGGSMEEFVERIMAWVLRKGIGSFKTKSGNNSKSADSYDAMQSAAYAIALNILQNGIKPHPFLYPAIDQNKEQLQKDLSNL